MNIFEIEGPDGSIYEVEAESIEQAAAAVNSVGEDKQTFWQKVKGLDLGTTLNKAGEAMTFGLIGDEADAALAGIIPGGMNYEERLEFNRRNEENLERDNPGLALGAEIGGSLVGAALPLGAIGTLGRGAGMAKRVGASMLAGGAMGGTYGFMEGEGAEDRVSDALTGARWGAAGGAAAPAIGAGVKKVADSLVRRPAVKKALKSAQTAADQRATSRANYRAFEGEGLEVTMPAYRRMQGQVEQAIGNVEPSRNMAGPLGRPSQASRDILDTLSQTGDAVDAAVAKTGDPGARGAIRVGSLDDIRKEVGQLAMEVDTIGRPTRGATSAAIARDSIDQFIDSLGPDDIAAGDKDAAISALKKAREMWRRSIKTQAVENAIDASEGYLGGRESGLRNKIGSMLRRNNKTKMFSPEEEKALRKVLGNTMAGRAIRAIGDGLGRKAMMVTGGAMGGIDGAAIGAATGELASQVGESKALRSAEIARALISTGALNNLPQASESNRLIAEALARRVGAVAPQ